MLYDFELSAFCRKSHLIWFSSHERTGIFVRYYMYVISPFHPSFDSQQTHTSYTMNSEFHTPVEWFMQILYKTWMEGIHDKHDKSTISLWLLNQIGWGFWQNADYSFTILKHIDWFIILKVIDAESRGIMFFFFFFFFFLGGGQSVYLHTQK